MKKPLLVLLCFFGIATSLWAQEHIRSAEMKSINLPGHGSVQGIHYRVDGSKIWTIESVHPAWPGVLEKVNLKPGFTIKVWAEARDGWRLIRTLVRGDCIEPVTFKGEPVCDNYFVAAFGQRDGRLFNLPIRGQVTIAPKEEHRAFSNCLFDGTNSGSENEILIKYHFTTNVNAYKHISIRVD